MSMTIGEVRALGVHWLITHSAFRRIGIGILGVFETILIYNLLGSIPNVLWYYIAFSGLYVLTVPFGAMISCKIGFRKSMQLAMIPLAICFTMLMIATSSPKPLIWLAGAIVFGICYKLLFWIPFHTEMIELSERGNRGKTVGTLNGLMVAMGVVLPLLSGWLISQFGYQSVLPISIVMTLLAIIPLRSVPEVKERFTFTYWRVWKEIFTRKRIKISIAYMADGAQSIGAGNVVWPLFMFIILSGEYMKLGMVTSAVVLIAAILHYTIGKKIDVIGSKKILRYGSMLVSLGWFVRMFVETAFHMFIVGSYHHLVSTAVKTPFDALYYDHAADQGHYVDEYSVVREMTIHSGRIIFLFISLFIIEFMGIRAVFLFAALGALIINLAVSDPKAGPVR